MVNVDILPVNDPPLVILPRPTDFIEFSEHMQPQLQTVTLPQGRQGMDVQDTDSFECGSCSSKPGTFDVSNRKTCEQEIDPATINKDHPQGFYSEWEPGRVSVTVQVKYGRLSVATKAAPGVIPLPEWAKLEVESYLDPTCKETTCERHKSPGKCDGEKGCYWNGKVCSCIKMNPGAQCHTIKMRGPSEAIRAAISAMQYFPEPYFNKFTRFHYGENELLTLTATDKRRPDIATDPDFFCGDNSQNDPSQIFSRGEISIQQKPINDPPGIGFFPLIQNPSFEDPAICQGPLTCDLYNEFCMGIVLHGAKGWESKGESGITFDGWTGDCDSAAGTQHLFLHSHDGTNLGKEIPSVSQSLTGFILGMEYTVTLKASARTAKDMGCLLNVSMIEDPSRTSSWLYSDEVSEAWKIGLIQMDTLIIPGVKYSSTWIPCRAWCDLSQSIEQVNPGSSTEPFSPVPEITFVAHSTEYKIKIFADRLKSQIGDRMVFVDDLQIKGTRVLVSEDVPLFMEGLQIIDPDVTDGSSSWIKTRPGGKFLFELKVTAMQGKFDLLEDPSGCTIMPAADNFQIDFAPNMIMNDEERIQYGIKCGVGTWANSTTFRTPCPQECLTCNPPVPFSWAGKGIPPDPCIRIPLNSLKITKTMVETKIPGLPLAAAVIIPNQTITLEGEIAGIRKSFLETIRYVPNKDFNTENRGREELIFEVNDKGNVQLSEGGSQIPEQVTTTTLNVFVKAINDPPTVKFTVPKLSLLEDTVLPLEGFQVDDADLNELKCKDGKCPKTTGILLLKLTALNGSFSISSLFPVSKMSTAIDMEYSTQFRSTSLVYSEPKVYQCMWRQYCDDLTSRDGDPQLGLDFFEPCAHLPRYHTLAECVEYKLPFCQLVRALLDGQDRELDMCTEYLANTAMDTKKFAMLDDNEIEVIKRFQKRLILGSVSTPVAWITGDMFIVVGALTKLQEALEEKLIRYQPDQDYNGEDSITVQLNDLGNEGMQFPCPTPPDLPQQLHLEHCMKTRPYTAAVTQALVPVTVRAINDKPFLVMFDSLGKQLPEFQSFLVVQNISTPLPRLKVIDVDLVETDKAEMSVSLIAKSGALSYDVYKVTKLEVNSFPGGSRLEATGLLENINNLMANLEYRSDPQMLGVDQIMIEVDDKGLTGELAAGQDIGPVAFFVTVLVNSPARCEYKTCEECTRQLLEACGWCPSSCGGAGKCRAALALKDRRAPLFGVCLPHETEKGTLEWNQCEYTKDNSWIKGAVGAPLLFFFIVFTHILFMWCRKMHGSIVIYGTRVVQTLLMKARRMYLMPPHDASLEQLGYVIGFVLLILLVPDIITIVFTRPPLTIELGEATYFTLNTDACQVFLKSKPQLRSGLAQVSLQAWVTAEDTGLSDVFVTVGTCSETQYFEIVNRRKSSEKYKGYSCVIHLSIPQPISLSVIPALTITNQGTKVTSITQQRTLSLDMGSSFLKLEGTSITLDLTNSKLRLFQANILSGYIRMLNTTFEQVRITTKDAPILLGASAEESMDIRTEIEVQQNENNICLISAVSLVASEVYGGINRCDRPCANVTEAVRLSKKELRDGGYSPTAMVLKNVTSVQCVWKCSKPSTYTLMPYRKNADASVRSRFVTLYSENGEIQYSTVPMNRLPPYADRMPLDKLLILDGLDGARKVQVPSAAAAVLNVDFHPGGANRPVEDFFIFRFQGPSRPQGYFVWTSDSRYLVLPRELLAVVSVNLLVPTSMEAYVSLSPSECPYFDSQPPTFEPIPLKSFQFTV